MKWFFGDGTPTANPDTATRGENSVVTLLNVLANDSSNITNPALQIVSGSLTEPTRGGTAAIVSDADGDRISYQPAMAVSGGAPETFSYTVENADGGRASAQVSINIVP